MQYIIGMDGGGTKTHCLITNLDGKILYECTGGASNFLVIGTEKVSETIFNLIQSCKQQVGISFSDISSIVLGTTGAGRRNDAEKLENAFKEYSHNHGADLDFFHVESDARIALEGAFSGNPGSILIAGTGSIIFGKDSEGNIHRVGGFGRFLGDEGSGFVIGKKGLAAVSKEFDGRSIPTNISKLVEEKFGINSSEKLINEIYRNNFDIASAAPLVIQAAEQGDAIALKIIDEETDELLFHLSAMAKKLNQQEMNVSFIGGIITHDNIYSKTLRKKIALKLPNVKVKESENSPTFGAVLMAKEILKTKNF